MRFAALVVVLFAVCSSFGTVNAADSSMVRLALVCGGMTPMLAEIAINDRSFERAGLQVDKYCFPGGAPAVQALVGKGVDVFIGSYEHVLRQRERGFNVKAYGEIFDGMSYVLVAKASSPFRTLTDLKGHTIGITAAGSLSDTAVREGLKAANLNPDRDVEIVNVGSGLTMLVALESNRISAGMITEPTTTTLLADGNYRLVYNDTTPFAGNVLIANGSWVDAHRDAMRRLLAALRAVESRTRANPGSAIAPLLKDFPTVGPRIMLQAIMHQLAHVPRGLLVERRGTRTVEEIELKLGDIKTAAPFAQTVDDSLLAPR